MTYRVWDGAKVYRGPASSGLLREEQTVVAIQTDEDFETTAEAMRMQFVIGSKGGGRTAIRVVVDRYALLEELREAGWLFHE